MPNFEKRSKKLVKELTQHTHFTIVLQHALEHHHRDGYADGLRRAIALIEYHMPEHETLRWVERLIEDLNEEMVDA